MSAFADIAAAPDWLAEKMERSQRFRALASPTLALEIDEDDPSAVVRATAWLRDSAPDHGTYGVACRVKDFGISEAMCGELMLEHWRDARGLGKGDEHVLFRVANAYRYGTSPVGVASPEAEFEDVSAEVVDRRTRPPEPKRLCLKPLEPFEFASLPRRRWVVEQLAIRGIVSGLIAPGGVGKSTFLIALALAVVTGREDILGFKIRERTRVLLWNQEDDEVELHRRLAATMIAHGIEWSDLEHEGRRMLFVESGVGRPLTFTQHDAADHTRAAAIAQEMGDFIKAEDIGLAIFDPLVEFHEEPENDNVRMKAVAAVFRDTIAVASNCAVILAHHTNKPKEAGAESGAGDMNVGRGAGSLVFAFRLASTLFGVGEDTAKRYGIPESERHLYNRWDGAKSNVSLVGGEPTFFRKEGVRVGIDGGESVGMLRPVKLTKGKSDKERDKDDLIRGVVDLLETTPQMTAADVARALTADPMYSDKSPEGLAKAIKRIFGGGLTVEGRGAISIEKMRHAGKAGQASSTLVFTPCGQADNDREAVSA